jgi:hypothetical protein
MAHFLRYNAPAIRQRNMPEEGQASAKTGPKSRTVLSAASKDSPKVLLIEAEFTRWEGITKEVRQQELGFINERFHELLNELYDTANLCVERHQILSKNHIWWRRTVIAGTGVVAVVNIVAANRSMKELTAGIISVAAAVVAAVLSIIANLESFYNAAEKAQGYRESRELFLDAARDFDRRWDVYVRPFSDSPEACVNSAELYRQLVIKDSELRAKLKELTKTEGRGSKK